MIKRVKGREELSKRLAKLGVQLQTRVENELWMASEGTRTRVVADIRKQKIPAGLDTQRVGGPGRHKHIPSPPYGPPNADTGNLMGRYTSTAFRPGRTVSVVRLVAGVRYAAWLEYGTARMLPRPHLIPRYREAIPKLTARLRTLLGQAVKK